MLGFRTTGMNVWGVGRKKQTAACYPVLSMNDGKCCYCCCGLFSKIFRTWKSSGGLINICSFECCTFVYYSHIHIFIDRTGITRIVVCYFVSFIYIRVFPILEIRSYLSDSFLKE